MGQLLAFPTHRILRRSVVPTDTVISLPGYGNPVPFDNDGRGGSLSDKWRSMCMRHGVDCGANLIGRIPMLHRSLPLEARERSEYVIFVRDLGQGRGVAAAFPRIVLFESRTRRMLFFAKGSIDAERTIAALGRQIGEAFGYG